MKKSNFKRNWDIWIAYLISVLSILFFLIAINSCHDYGCIGALILPFFGLGLASLIAIIGIIRTFVKKLPKTRLAYFIPFIFFVIWLIHTGALNYIFGGSSQ